MIAATRCSALDPLPPRKRYSWETRKNPPEPIDEERFMHAGARGALA